MSQDSIRPKFTAVHNRAFDWYRAYRSRLRKRELDDRTVGKFEKAVATCRQAWDLVTQLPRPNNALLAAAD